MRLLFSLRKIRVPSTQPIQRSTGNSRRTSPAIRRNQRIASDKPCDVFSSARETARRAGQRIFACEIARLVARKLRRLDRSPPRQFILPRAGISPDSPLKSSPLSCPSFLPRDEMVNVWYEGIRIFPYEFSFSSHGHVQTCQFNWRLVVASPLRICYIYICVICVRCDRRLLFSREIIEIVGVRKRVIHSMPEIAKTRHIGDRPV